MALPPEILDKIFEHIPRNRGGRQTLIACALRTTWRTGPNQRRLLSSVLIHQDNYKRWTNGVVQSGSKACLFEHAHSVWHCPKFGLRVQDLPWDSRKYFLALPNPHSLALYSVRLERVRERTFRTSISAFHETLINTSLDIVTISLGALVILADYFPNITTLQLRSLGLEPDKGLVPSLSQPLQGRVYARSSHVDYLKFFNRFAKLDLECGELLIGSFFTRGALQISAKILKEELPIIASPVFSDRSRIHRRVCASAATGHGRCVT